MAVKPYNTPYPITVYAGADFRLEASYVDDDDNPVDTTGYEARSQVRKFAQSPSIELEFDVDIDDAGEVVASATAVETAELDIDAGVWDLEIESPGGVITKLLWGKVTVIPDVTR